MTAILGISAFYHDSAAALVVDGKILAAAQQERFSRVKHDAGFPDQAIAFCLHQAGLDAAELDYVGYYEKPLLKLDRLLETALSVAPRGFRSFRAAMPEWWRDKLHVRSRIRRGLGNAYRRRIVLATHHQSHAASAFYPSPFEQAAILTMDGVGEWATTTTGVGRGGRIELNEQIRFPHSLGLLYSALTGYCGFRVNSGEYKLMGLAPYGEPRYVDLIKDRLVHVRADGSFRLNLDYFGFCHSLRMTNRRFHRLFGRGPRRPDQPLEDLDRDLAASVQKVTEEVVLRAARHVHARTQLDNLVMAGGVALNCVANGRLLREGPFERLWIQPAAGDAGGALGVALLIWHQLLGRQRQVTAGDGQRSSLLGPRFSPHQVRETLDRCGADYRVIASAAEMNCQVARLLARGNVVGRFCGPAEFGPRALGNRSILADPRVPDMQTKLNLKIKFRESFRPFAPAVLAERADEFFELPPGTDSPYMLLVGQVRGDALPAVRHVDGSARIQTVDRTGNPEFAGLLEAFDRETGCPVLVNTSLNVRGEPIVGTPADAYRCFDRTDMDALVIGDCLLVKAAHAHARGQGLHA